MLHPDECEELLRYALGYLLSPLIPHKSPCDSRGLARPCTVRLADGICEAEQSVGAELLRPVLIAGADGNRIRQLITHRMEVDDEFQG